MDVLQQVGHHQVPNATEREMYVKTRDMCFTTAIKGQHQLNVLSARSKITWPEQ
jgi:hypothetical protein